LDGTNWTPQQWGGEVQKARKWGEPKRKKFSEYCAAGGLRGGGEKNEKKSSFSYRCMPRRAEKVKEEARERAKQSKPVSTKKFELRSDKEGRKVEERGGGGDLLYADGLGMEMSEGNNFLSRFRAK